MLLYRLNSFRQSIQPIFFSFLIKKAKKFFGGMSKPQSLPSQKRHAISENV
jgi:hypothetical protein